MRITITIDDALLEEAFSLSKVKSRNELVELSLQELVRKKRLEHLAGLYSSGAVTADYEELKEYRSDE